MVVLIKGAGDIATGIACRLHRSGFKIVMTETMVPTTVRRTVAFSRAVYENEAIVEGIKSVLCKNINEINNAVKNNYVAIIVDENCNIIKELCPDVLVDAILAKKNLNTKIADAKCVVGVGPGFTALKDCHAVVETKRGHTLGRVIYTGSAIENTGIPGDIGGYTTQRILRATADGVFEPLCEIGCKVKKGDKVAKVNDTPIYAEIDGVLRGILQKGVVVEKGLKAGDIDPRCETSHCLSVSDKALSVGGGVLEAIMHFNCQGG